MKKRSPHDDLTHYFKREKLTEDDFLNAHDLWIPFQWHHILGGVAERR